MNKYNILSLVILLILFSGCIRKNESHKKQTIQQDILINGKPKTEQAISEFLFVGKLENKSALFRYRISDNSYSLAWQKDNEIIIEFSYGIVKKSAFFLTAKDHGKRGVFPFINNAKLYYFPKDSINPIFLDNIGSGLQAFAFWESDSIFKVVLNVMDLNVGKYVYQSTKRYNFLGIKLTDETKKFELSKDGFPQVPQPSKKLISPNKRYSLLAIDSTLTEYFLVDNSNSPKKLLITKQTQKLNFADWTSDGRFLVFTTIDISPMNESLYDAEPQTSKLFIYSLIDKKTVDAFEGGGVKNFLLSGNLLIFDDGFRDRAKIFIYNLALKKIVDTVSVPGGCGLRNIPLIPDYEA